jgi:hypothetical protein
MFILLKYTMDNAITAKESKMKNRILHFFFIFFLRSLKTIWAKDYLLK